MKLNIKKIKQPNQKWAEEKHFSKEVTNDQKEHEKIFNVANYQRNANQNYTVVSTQTSQKSHYQSLQTTDAEEGVEKR